MSDFPVQAPPVEQPFFEGCAEGELRLQHCTVCGSYQFYPRVMCHHCWSRDLEWEEASGKGIILSFTVVRIAVSAEYEAPYVVALVKLAEGPTMMSQIRGCAPEEVKVGAGVHVAFADIAGRQAMPVFEPETN